MHNPNEWLTPLEINKSYHKQIPRSWTAQMIGNLCTMGFVIFKTIGQKRIILVKSFENILEFYNTLKNKL